MSIIGSNILAGASGQGGEYTIEESLRFNRSQSSYLSRTLGTATNAYKWTWSGWVKRGSLGVDACIFSGGQSAGDANVCNVRFSSNDVITMSSDGTNWRITTQVFRDASAWYHLIISVDTTQATAANRILMYVNGNQITSFSASNNPTQNTTIGINKADLHDIGYRTYPAGLPFDGYLTEVNFIDGQALDASSFGEFDSVTGVWKPSEYTGTYGTNGFYLPMQLDNTVEGFNTVTYLGNGSTQKISGVGFSPSLVWIKSRSNAYDHQLFDVVRGVNVTLQSNSTASEANYGSLPSFNSDGFSVSTAGGAIGTNSSGGSFVAWCWDAGSSTVSNTDGSITSSVRANPAYGFSVISYTGTGSNATVGHGLGAAPSMVIIKQRNGTGFWVVGTSSLSFTSDNYLRLNATSAVEAGGGVAWNNTAPTSTTVSIGNSTVLNASGNDYVMYCFSEVAGYSKFGSYTGTGASGNTVTTGFKPAFVMIKRTDVAGENWFILDSTRNANNVIANYLRANLSDAEAVAGTPIFNFLSDGFQLTNSAGAYNASGGTYIYMAFKDTREYAYWLDDSGNNNDWQPNGGITTESTVTDTPTPYADGGNYCTFNPLFKLGGTAAGTWALNGNLQAKSDSGQSMIVFGTMGLSPSTKFYNEFTMTNVVENNDHVGIVTDIQASADSGTCIAYKVDGQKIVNGVTSAYGASYTDGDVIGIAVNLVDNEVTFYKNGSSQGAITGVTSGTYFHRVRFNNLIGQQADATGNWGQRPFAYTPPTGFLPLHTGNLPDSAIVDGSAYFDAVTWTGDNATSRAITGLEFQPSFTWVKSRSLAASHNLVNAIVGAEYRLRSNSTGAENFQAENGYVSSFNSDGFTLAKGSDTDPTYTGWYETNQSGQTYVAWNWKANGAGVSNTDGSITSTVSATPTSEFSIVTFTANGGTAETVGHGLGVAPRMIILKDRELSTTWLTYHASTTDTVYKYLGLNTTAATTTNASTVWGSALPTSSVFGVNSTQIGGSTNDFVAYCFADVEGYSKFGKYTGNGSTDGPFVYTGFRPAFVMFKSSSGAYGWATLDSSRSAYNVFVATLYPEKSDAEYNGAGHEVDLLGNGFKLRNSNTRFNASGGTYIYMAFAENPFKNSLAR